MLKLVWKSRKTTFKSSQKLAQIHASQQAEWEWIDRRLSEHFQQESPASSAHSAKKKA